MSIVFLQEKQRELIEPDKKNTESNVRAVNLTDNNAIHMCMIANHNDDTCDYAICEQCWTYHMYA